MSTFAWFLSNAPSGLYGFVDDRIPADAKMLCRLKRVELLRVTARRARDKQRFLAVVARALRLPRWFGMNWDALADCLTQFAWQPGSTHLLLLSSLGGFAKQSPPDFAMALAVLEDAASFWEQRGVRFLILIESPSLTHSLRLPRVATR
jgi:hypothetical protein